MKRLIILLMLLVAPVGAQTVGQTPVGATNATSGTAVTIALTSTIATEIPIIVCYTASATNCTVSDNHSSVYTKDATFAGTTPTNSGAIYSACAAGTGVTSLTITPPAGGWVIAFAITVKGLLTSSCFDKTNGHQTASGTTYTSNATPTLSQANEIWVALAASGNTGAGSLTATSGTNWAAIVNNTSDGDTARPQEAIVTSTAAVTATGTTASGDQPVWALIATYKAASAVKTMPPAVY